VAFRFKRASCIVAGTFNMHIVQPVWLAGRGILPKGVAVAIESKLDEPLFRFHSPKLRTRWMVSQTRIEVETLRADEDCGKPVADLLSELPWTPLQAIGNNAIYVAGHSELDRLPSIRHLFADAPDGYTMKQRSFHVAPAKDERTFNLQLSVTPEEVELSVNAHVEQKEKSSEVARTAASQFFQHRSEAEGLIRNLFNVEVEYANADAQPS